MQAASNPLLLAEALTAETYAFADDIDVSGDLLDDERPLALDDDESDLARALRRYLQADVLPGKVAFVERACRQIVAEGRKVVLWTVFLGNVKYLEDRLADLRPLSVSGLVPLSADNDDEEGESSREQRIELFKSVADRRVLIANMGACSESISLHKACQDAVFLERNFNAAQFIQSLDRIHRQGMPKGTIARFMVPSIPCALERVLNRRLRERQKRLYQLLDDPMPVVGFDDDAHRGMFDIDEEDDLGELFEEVLSEIRKQGTSE
jgi:hypothetical protein